MEADREKLRVHVKLGCPDGYSVDVGQIKGHFPYVGEEQVKVELCAAAHHPKAASPTAAPRRGHRRSECGGVRDVPRREPVT